MIEVRDCSIPPSRRPPTPRASWSPPARGHGRRIDLHRAGRRRRPGARHHGTAGRAVTASGAGWTVAQRPIRSTARYIATVAGTDAPPGSWRRVWYRATAWTAPDDTRGALAGRSTASNVAWNRAAASAGPVLSAPQTGGGTRRPMSSCSGPARRRSLHAARPAPDRGQGAGRGSAGRTAPLLSLDAALDALDGAARATAQGAWIVGTSAGLSTYRAIIRGRRSPTRSTFAVRITDPLGRTAARRRPSPAAGRSRARAGEPGADHRPGPPGSTLLTFTSSAPVVAPLGGDLLQVTGFGLGALPAGVIAHDDVGQAHGGRLGAAGDVRHAVVRRPAVDLLADDDVPVESFTVQITRLTAGPPQQVFPDMTSLTITTITPSDAQQDLQSQGSTPSASPRTRCPPGGPTPPPPPLTTIRPVSRWPSARAARAVRGILGYAFSPVSSTLASAITGTGTHLTVAAGQGASFRAQAAEPSCSPCRTWPEPRWRW